MSAGIGPRIAFAHGGRPARDRGQPAAAGARAHPVDPAAVAGPDPATPGHRSARSVRPADLPKRILGHYTFGPFRPVAGRCGSRTVAPWQPPSVPCSAAVTGHRLWIPRQHGAWAMLLLPGAARRRGEPARPVAARGRRGCACRVPGVGHRPDMVANPSSPRVPPPDHRLRLDRGRAGRPPADRLPAAGAGGRRRRPDGGDRVPWRPAGHPPRPCQQPRAGRPVPRRSFRLPRGCRATGTRREWPPTRSSPPATSWAWCWSCGPCYGSEATRRSWDCRSGSTSRSWRRRSSRCPSPTPSWRRRSPRGPPGCRGSSGGSPRAARPLRPIHVGVTEIVASLAVVIVSLAVSV